MIWLWIAVAFVFGVLLAVACNVGVHDRRLRDLELVVNDYELRFADISAPRWRQ